MPFSRYQIAKFIASGLVILCLTFALYMKWRLDHTFQVSQFAVIEETGDPISPPDKERQALKFLNDLIREHPVLSRLEVHCSYPVSGAVFIRYDVSRKRLGYGPGNVKPKSWRVYQKIEPAQIERAVSKKATLSALGSYTRMRNFEF